MVHLQALGPFYGLEPEALACDLCTVRTQFYGGSGFFALQRSNRHTIAIFALPMGIGGRGRR